MFLLNSCKEKSSETEDYLTVFHYGINIFSGITISFSSPSPIPRLGGQDTDVGASPSSQQTCITLNKAKLVLWFLNFKYCLEFQTDIFTSAIIFLIL